MAAKQETAPPIETTSLHSHFTDDAPKAQRGAPEVQRGAVACSRSHSRTVCPQPLVSSRLHLVRTDSPSTRPPRVCQSVLPPLHGRPAGEPVASGAHTCASRNSCLFGHPLQQLAAAPAPRHQQFGSQELLSALSKHLQEEKWSHCQYQKPDLNPPKRIDFSGQNPFSRARGSMKSCQSKRFFPSSYLLLPSEGVCAPIWVDWPVASALSPNHPALPT